MKSGLKIIIVVVVVLVVLPGSYLAGNGILANAIKSSYQAKDCAQVLAQDDFYARAYPAALADPGVAGMASECALYSPAVAAEDKKTWQAAYEAYTKYIQTYPRGRFVGEAQEHSALALTSMAKDQLAAKKYADALATIDLVSKSFGRTAAATDASSLISGVYIAQAADQRAAGDFSGAETTLKTFQTRAKNANRTGDAKSAQHELALTYLAWGQALQAQKQFENAKAKFDQAVATDPEPSAEAGPAAQAKAAQVKLQSAWGDMFLEKNDFVNAIERYQTAISLAEAKDQPDLKDQIAVAYVKWAASLSSNQDFLGALAKISEAASSASTSAGKQSVESARNDTYSAFSHSTGDQAQKAIAAAAEAVCLHKQPAMPIFGIDPNTIRAYSYVPGSTENLTDAVRATTPASLHFVACGTASTKSETQKRSFTRLMGGRNVIVGGAYVTMTRVTTSWAVQLYDLKTGRQVATQLFAGGIPLGWGDIWDIVKIGPPGDFTFPGTDPSLETISAWVQKYLK